MFKIILKNFWMRRRSNGWLFAEIVIVTILTWVMVDPTVVSLYERYKSFGYDTDRIVNIQVGEYSNNAEKYDAQYESIDEKWSAIANIMRKAEALPEVEQAERISTPINSQFISYAEFKPVIEGLDTLSINSHLKINLRNGEKFFSTYGIEASSGSPGIETIEKEMRNYNCVITETVDRLYWPNSRSINGKRFIYMTTAAGDTVYMNVIGIVKDFRANSVSQNPSTILVNEPDPMSMYPPSSFVIALRLHNGINTESYIKDQMRLINSTIRAGNYYVTNITDQNSDIIANENSWGITYQRYLQLGLTVFFLLSMILGVIGCVRLQTSKRETEMGILRSFGATRSNIIKMLMCETIVLATIGFIIGDFIFLQFAIKEGLNSYFNDFSKSGSSSDWVTNFRYHFTIVSAIVYMFIIVCVVIGTYFPARHLSRIEPVDALRDE